MNLEQFLVAEALANDVKDESQVKVGDLIRPCGYSFSPSLESVTRAKLHLPSQVLDVLPMGIPIVAFNGGYRIVRSWVRCL